MNVPLNSDSWTIEMCMSYLKRCNTRAPRANEIASAIQAIQRLSQTLSSQPSQQLRVWTLLQSVDHHMQSRPHDQQLVELRREISGFSQMIASSLISTDVETFNSVFKQIAVSDAETRKLARNFYRVVTHPTATRAQAPSPSDLLTAVQQSSVRTVEMLLLQGVRSPQALLSIMDQLKQDPHNAQLLQMAEAMNQADHPVSQWTLSTCLAKLDRYGTWSSRLSPKATDLSDAVAAMNRLGQLPLTPVEQLELWSRLQSIRRPKSGPLNDAISNLTGLLQGSLYPVDANEETRIKQINSVAKALRTAPPRVRDMSHRFYQQTLRRNIGSPKNLSEAFDRRDAFGVQVLLLAYPTKSSRLKTQGITLMRSPNAKDWQILEAMIRSGISLNNDFRQELVDKAARSDTCPPSVMYAIANRASKAAYGKSAWIATDLLWSNGFLQNRLSEKTIKGWLILWLRYTLENENLDGVRRSVLEDVMALEPDLSIAELIGLIPIHLLKNRQGPLNVFALCWKPGPAADQVRKLLLPLHPADSVSYIRQLYLEPKGDAPLGDLSGSAGPLPRLEFSKSYQYQFQAAGSNPIQIGQEDHAAWNALIADSPVLQAVEEGNETTLPLPPSITEDAFKWILYQYTPVHLRTEVIFKKDAKQMGREVAVAIESLQLKSLAARPLDPQNQKWLISGLGSAGY